MINYFPWISTNGEAYLRDRESRMTPATRPVLVIWDPRAGQLSLDGRPGTPKQRQWWAENVDANGYFLMGSDISNSIASYAVVPYRDKGVEIQNTYTDAPAATAELPFGLQAIIGVSREGKSSAIMAIQQATMGTLKGLRVRMGENEYSYLPASPLAIGGAIELAVVSGSNLLLLDSLRHYFIAGRGNAGIGGVPRETTLLLDLLCEVGAHVGVTIMAVLNPLLPAGTQAFEAFEESVKGSMTGVVRSSTPAADSIMLRQFGRANWGLAARPALRDDGTQHLRLALDKSHEFRTSPAWTSAVFMWG